MTLSPGSRLGPYEIVAPLGSGGMGSVYRATDSRLGRQVAIKSLRSDLSANAALRQQFEREARAAASLNHPHICTLHDIGDHEGQAFLVMELLEGETLAARLQRSAGGLPFSEVLSIGAQVAEALAAAHRLGIVHRDVKPANIMLTKAGAKLVDFGVARLRELSDASIETLTQTAVTDEHVLAGTLPYMAPEQLEGAADARSDLFALGSVLFEMAVGRRAFAADSAASLIADIVHATPPSIATLRPDAPHALARTVTRCLAKDPDKRWQSGSDLADELRWIDGATVATHLPPLPARSAGSMRALGMVVAFTIGAAGYLFGLSRSTPDPSPYVDDVELPAGTTHWAGLAIAPNGRQIALVTQPARQGPRDARLWIRETGAASDWRLISGAGDEIPTYPFWSPDSQSLAYFVGGKLVRVELSSEAAVPVAEAPDPRGGTWLDDGKLVYAPTSASGLWIVRADGGAPTLLIDRRPDEIGLKFPVRVDARHILYWVHHADAARAGLQLLDLDNPGSPKPVVLTRYGGAFDRNTVFFWRDGLLMGQRLDVATGELSGPLARLAVDLHAGSANSGTPNVGAGGGHVLAANLRPAVNQLTWVDRTGKVIGELGDPGPSAKPELSPDGRRLAVERRVPGQAGSSLWLLDLDTGSSKPLTPGADGTDARWSPDGTQLLFRSLRGVAGNGNLYRLTADDPARVDPVVEGFAALWPSGWLPDGRGIAFHSTTDQAADVIVPFPAGLLVKEFDRPPTLVRAVRNPGASRLSPDGSRLAFVTNESGQAEVFVDTFPKPSPRPVQVSRGGGIAPSWRSDGQELYFLSASRVMTVSLPTGAPLDSARAVPLFALPPGSSVTTQYAVAPDGGRFLLVVPTVDASASVKLTLNWKREP
jgi:eukaryotic-like serine/threonine-protein kinase